MIEDNPYFKEAQRFEELRAKAIKTGVAIFVSRQVRSVELIDVTSSLEMVKRCDTMITLREYIESPL